MQYWQVALGLLHPGCDLNVLGLARNIVFFWVNVASVAVKGWFACPTVSGALTLAWNRSQSASALWLRCPGVSLSSRLTLCYCVLQLGLCKSQWIGCVKASRRVLVLQYNVLRFWFWFCFASYWWQITSELLRQECDLNVRICTKHCVFLGRWRFHCKENLVRLRDGCGRRHFNVQSVSTCLDPRARCIWGVQVICFFSVDAVLLQFSLRSGSRTQLVLHWKWR